MSLSLLQIYHVMAGQLVNNLEVNQDENFGDMAGGGVTHSVPPAIGLERRVELTKGCTVVLCQIGCYLVFSTKDKQ